MPVVKRAHKIRLIPNEEQRAYLFKACAASRKAYNWGLEQLNTIYDQNQKLYKQGKEQLKYPDPKYDLKKRYNHIKHIEFPWVTEVTSWTYQGAFDDLKLSLRRFWDIQKGKIALPKPKKPRKDRKRQGWPHWRNYRQHNGFYLANTAFRLDNNILTFDKKRCGPIEMSEKLRYSPAKILGGRVTFDGIYWWIAIQVETEIEQPQPKNEAVGVDLGIKYLAYTNDGDFWENPKAFYQAKAKLRRLQRKLDRQKRANNPHKYNPDGTIKRGNTQPWFASNRMMQTLREITLFHHRIANIRSNASHQMTATLSQEYQIIVLEDLNIKGMLQNGKLSKAISDAALYEKRRQFEYKAIDVITVGRWFPSSKTCSNCGFINAELTLSQRKWKCPECNSVLERDENAAKNLLKEGLRLKQQNNSPGGSPVTGQSISLDHKIA